MLCCGCKLIFGRLFYRCYSLFFGFRSLDNSEDDALFMNAYIAHKLDHVMHFERDEAIVREGGEVPNPFQTIIAKVEHNSRVSVSEVLCS